MMEIERTKRDFGLWDKKFKLRKHYKLLRFFQKYSLFYSNLNIYIFFFVKSNIYRINYLIILKIK